MAKSQIKLAPLPPTMSLFLEGPDKDKAIKIKEYIDDVASTYSVSEGFVKKLLQFVRQGIDDFSDATEAVSEYPKDQIKLGRKVISQLSSDYEKHLKNKKKWDAEEAERSENAKAERDKARAEAEKLKEEGKELFQEKLALAEKSVGNVLERVDSEILGNLGKKFSIDEETGLITASEKATEEDYADALAKLSNTAWGTKEIASRAAEIEASVAYNYAKRFPTTWKNLYIGRERDLSRINPNKRALDTLDEIEEKPFAKISVMRAILEVKVAPKEDKAYIQGKKDAIKAFKQFEEDNGRQPTQAECKEIVKQVRESYGIEVEKKPRYVALIRNDDGDIIFKYLYDEELKGENALYNYIAISIRVIELKSGYFYGEGEKGGIELSKPSELGKSDKKYIQSLITEVEEKLLEDAKKEAAQESERPAKKGAKKAAKPAPAEKEEEDEETPVVSKKVDDDDEEEEVPPSEEEE